jgi:hypothetical protein
MYALSLITVMHAALDENDTPLVRPMCDHLDKVPVKYGYEQAFSHCTGKLL